MMKLTRKRTGNLAGWGSIFVLAGMAVLPFADLGDIGMGVYGLIVLAGLNPGADITLLNILYWSVAINAVLATAFAVVLWRGIPPRWLSYGLMILSALAISVMLTHFIGAISDGAPVSMFSWGFWATLIGTLITFVAYVRTLRGFKTSKKRDASIKKPDAS